MKTYVPFSHMRILIKYALNLVLLFSIGNLLAQKTGQNLNPIILNYDLHPTLSVNETLSHGILNDNLNYSRNLNLDETQRTVTGVDLNGPTLPGTTYGTIAQMGGFLTPTLSADNTITTSTGTVTSAVFTFSMNSSGIPAGVPDAGENIYIIAADGVTQIGSIAINTNGAGLIYQDVYGSNTLNFSLVSLGVFSITEANGQPILTSNLQAFLYNLRYIHFGTVGTETNGIRKMILDVTDPNNTLSESSSIVIGPYGFAAVDDANSVMANSATSIIGNLTTNDPKNAPSDILTITEVNGYPGSVGNAFTSTYGTITVMSDGSYSYNVDTANIAVKSLSNGETLNDIISYAVTDNSGFFDFGYIDVTINGVTELPVATDNTNSVTVGSSPSASGDVLFDDDGFGVDSGDRPLAKFIWENQFSQGGTYGGLSDPINGQTRTEATTGVDISFTSSDVDNIGVPAQDQVVYLSSTNGGHTGYFGFVIDANVNPSAPSVLIMDFDEPVVNLSFTLSDVDYSQGDSWQDLFTVSGSIGGTDVPFDPQVSGSVITVGTDTFYGTGSVIASDAHGNVVISFPLPVDQVVLSYNYGPDATAADNGTQIAAVSDLIWQSTSVPRVSEVDGLVVNVGTQIATTYGFITINEDGTYNYIVDATNPTVANLPIGNTLTDIIPYTLIDTVDASGNTDTANLTITINGNLSIDTDNDGNPDHTDPNPTTQTALDDNGTGTSGIVTTIDIITNDDYFSNNDPSSTGTITIVGTGGSANGLMSFDPDTGELNYTPTFAEGGTTVTIDYQVCNDFAPFGGVAGPEDVCATATVTIVVAYGDEDGDGVSDNVDVCPGYDDNADHDGDGIPNGCDLDDDNDGIPDTTESYGKNPDADDDDDGIDNWEDENNGNSGERLLIIYDIDNDQVPNHRDLDSDNDGIYDVVEAGGIDLNNDGIADGTIDPLTGIPVSAGIAGIVPIETTPTIIDMFNLDSDGDGCSDSNEAYNNANADGGDGGQYGADPVNVDANNGTVLAAAYNTGNTQVPTVVIFDTDLDGDGLVGVCDFDGDLPPVNNGFDGILGVDENEKLNFNIYPNPTDTTVTIVGTFDVDNIEIYNTLGARILTTQENIIDVSHLNTGVYLLKIQSNGAFESKMLIIK